MREIIDQEIKEILKELKESLKIRRYSEATKRRYDTVVKGYLYYERRQSKNLRQLTEKDVLGYLQMLTEERDYKSSSYNNVNAILKYFLEIVLEKDISYRKLPNAKIGYRRPVVVSQEEFSKIYETSKNTRDKCFLLLAFGSGLRVSEIASLKVENIDSKNMKIKQIGKGDKERITVLPEQTLVKLREYCKEEKITKENKQIFLNKERKPIAASTVSYRIKELSDKSGVKKSAHKLRGGFATEMLRAGVELIVVQALMGHTSPETTSRYAEVVRPEDKIKNPLGSEFYE